MNVECCGITNAGYERPDNQDCILINHSLGLYAVCDGMGGHQQGELAAELAIKALQFSLEASRDRTEVTWPFGYNFEVSLDANRLITGVSLANREIWRRSRETLEATVMGTTVAAVLFSGGIATVAHVGDSRVYLCRSGELSPLTTDDTMLGGMMQRGLITEEKARTHPMRNVLMQAVGPQETVDVHVREDKLTTGDALLICSDGLHGFVAHGEMRRILSLDQSASHGADLLIEAALATGAPDNVSAVVLKYR